jgi:hypothetical protein
MIRELWDNLLKARPRRVENRVADELTQWSARRGDHWVFTRRPAMGRTGPDIEFPNPYSFVIDVKSRSSISDKFWKFTDTERQIKQWVHYPGTTGWYITRLDHFDAMFQMRWQEQVWTSVVVNRWLEHMRMWAADNSGVGMLVLHKPRKPIGSSVAVIRASDWLPLMETMREI